MCDHRLLDAPDGLLCTSKDPSPRHGHTYQSTTGSDIPDAPKEEL